MHASLYRKYSNNCATRQYVFVRLVVLIPKLEKSSEFILPTYANGEKPMNVAVKKQYVKKTR